MGLHGGKTCQRLFYCHRLIHESFGNTVLRNEISSSKFEKNITEILPYQRNVNFGTSHRKLHSINETPHYHFTQLGSGKMKQIALKCRPSTSDYFPIQQRNLHSVSLNHTQQQQFLEMSSSSNGKDSNGDTKIKPALDAMTPNVQPPESVYIVPGKGPPPVPPVDCCMCGCANCVWIQYAEELKTYFSEQEGTEKAREAIEKIEHPGLQMFLKLELGFL